MAEFSPSRVDDSIEGDVADEAADALDDHAATIAAVSNGSSNSGDDQRDKEALAQGLFHLFKPAIDQIDDRVKAVRQSQVELRAHIDNLAEDLRRISDCRVVPIDLDPYIKKLVNTRRRILVVANVLQTVQDRVNKVNYYVNREKTKKKQTIKSSTTKLMESPVVAESDGGGGGDDDVVASSAPTEKLPPENHEASTEVALSKLALEPEGDPSSEGEAPSEVDTARDEGVEGDGRTKEEKLGDAVTEDGT